MCKTDHDLPEFATYTKQSICDNTLDDAQLATRCPLDKVRCSVVASPPRYSAGQLDQLPTEILIQVLLYADIPSLTGFRRANRRTMELVDSIPQYAAIIKHCPDVIRAILSIQADAFDCDLLYRTLRTTRCSTCARFGDHLYLITCRRVCYFCFTRRLEYCPLTMGRALRFFNSDRTQSRSAMNSRQRLCALNPPTVLSLPGRYCTAWTREGGNSQRMRFRLFDRRAVMQDKAESHLTKPDKTTREPRRFMAVITVPYLFDYGRQADWGYFCLGCKEEKEEKTRHFRIKYTREEISGHIASHPVLDEPTKLSTISPSHSQRRISSLPGFTMCLLQRAAFIKTDTVQFAGVHNLWHPAKLDELDFTRQDRVRQRVHVSTHPKVNNGRPVLVKLAVWPWEISSMETETAAYQRISDTGVGPKFLGHLTEGKDGRVVGFVTEWLERARAAGPGDMDGCKKALGRLHQLGIRHGEINKHNFLVRDGGHDVVLVDFEVAERECSSQKLEDEMRALSSSLKDTSYRGGEEPSYECQM